MYKEQRLLNKKTIVTGGARGIGAGIVKRLYAEGAEIIISDFREELALDLIQECHPRDTLKFDGDCCFIMIGHFSISCSELRNIVCHCNFQ